MWIYPTRGRPQACAALLQSMARHAMFGPGILMLSAADPCLTEYQAIELPARWTSAVVYSDGVDTADKLRTAFGLFGGEPWYGWIADDNTVETTGFEQRLVNAAGAWGMASGNDHWQADPDPSRSRCHGATVIGGDLLRALGWIVPPGVEHCCIDDAWEHVGRELGAWRILMDVSTPHRWAADDPVTAAGGATLDAGRAAFARWLATAAEEDIARARLAHWETIGLSIDRARQRSVLLAFPVYDRPHHRHECAAMSTVALLTRLGIRHGFVHVQGQPTHTARNLLAKAFRDSDFTDMLFIDADMAWRPWDVVRLLAQRHPLIGGVGRKRNDRPDTDGRAWCFTALDHRPARDAAGCFEVRHIGTGFLLINRLVFDAIEQHGTPDRVGDADGVPYVRFFAWSCRDGAEIGEDYGFCDAYRGIGGRVMADPSIELSHFGATEHRARLITVLT